jgi:uncharacterized protein (TIGR03437 family)
MQRGNRLILAKVAVVTAAIPFLLYGYFYGPDPGYTGAPSDNGGATCATAGCHSGTANQFTTGSVAVGFPNGMTYTPGVAQQLSVTIADSATTQKSWGFQLTPRVASSPGTMAGTLTSASDGSTQIMYSETNLQIFCAPGTLTGQTPTCPGASNSTLYPLQFVEHSYNGYRASVGTTGSYTYSFTWTPPATNVGNITIYVAGNAGTGTVVQTTTPPAGDHIYSTSYTLTPASGGGTVPVIASAGIQNGASFQTGIVPNSWITIQGTNLYSGSPDTWGNSIVNGNLPTKLDGVSVSVGGQPAYIYYVSGTQINAIAPNVGTGSLPVTVTNAAGTSSAVTAVSQTVQPAFFLWPGGYAVATHFPSYDYAVKNGTFSGATTTPANPGETIILWGTGFGPTTPAFPVGVATPTSQLYLTTPVTVMIGGVAASVYQGAAFLSPGAASLYQVTVTVPSSLTAGDYPVVASISGASSPSTTMITVQ